MQQCLAWFSPLCTVFRLFLTVQLSCWWQQYDASPHRRRAVARTWVRLLLTVLWGHSCVRAVRLGRSRIEETLVTFSLWWRLSSPLMVVTIKASFDQWKTDGRLQEVKKTPGFYREIFHCDSNFFCQQLPSCTLGGEWPHNVILTFEQYWAFSPEIAIAVIFNQTRAFVGRL